MYDWRTASVFDIPAQPASIKRHREGRKDLINADPAVIVAFCGLSFTKFTDIEAPVQELQSVPPPPKFSSAGHDVDTTEVKPAGVDKMLEGSKRVSTSLSCITAQLSLA